MIWTQHYIPPNPTIWRGRADAPIDAYFFQIIKPVNLLDNSTSITSQSEQSTFALLGFCCDEGVRRNGGRVGAAQGPAALRSALAGLAVHRSDLTCYDVGDITCVDGQLENAQQALSEVVALLLQQGMTPLIIGGGHELAWGHYQGIAQALANDEVGIVNMDAHFDMRPLLPGNQGSSGTPFLQIAKALQSKGQALHYYCIGIQRMGNTRQLFDTAEHYDTEVFFADNFDHQQVNDAANNFVNRIITQHSRIYLTLCMDVLASAFAPAVSAPQSMGISPWQMMPLVKLLAASGRVISYDIAELCPVHDIDQRTAKLAAALVYEIVHSHKT